MDLERSVIHALRIEHAQKSDSDTGWELWGYRLRDPVSQTQLAEQHFLLFVKSKGLSKAELPELDRRLRSRMTTRNLSVAMQRSTPLSREFVKAALGARSVKFMSELLQQECRHLLGNSHGVVDPFPYFVEPIVDDKLALVKLGRWVMAEADGVNSAVDEDELSLAALLAPAGVGKTSLARELVRSLQLRPQHDVFPLLIEPRQWSSLNPNEPLSLWSLIRHALESGGHNAIPQEAFELFAKAGCITVVFDGLDELGSIRLGTITPAAVVDQLLTLAAESDFRILLTSRDGLWSELVPDDIRQRVREFHLLPFRKDQIARYREKRFPNPRKPERDRFDKILEAVTAAAHPHGTGKIRYEERAPAAPLILHLVATEAEEYSDGAKDYNLADAKFKNPLYTITYGILNREHTRRNLCLNPGQQFMMISTLVVDMGIGPYSSKDIESAAEYALGSSLKEAEKTALKSHPLLIPAGEGIFAFRFEYLAQFAPAVWLVNYVIGNQSDLTVEKYLNSIVGRTSPVLAFVADLLRDSDWKTYLSTHVKRLRQNSATQSAAVPFLWELAQSLLPVPGQADRSRRTSIVGDIFGIREQKETIFTGLFFAGPIAYMDLRATSFRVCTFHNCQWISCDADATTSFQDCVFRGRFTHAHSGGTP